MHFSNISTSKSGPRLPVLTLFTSKCASRHNGLSFFHISTSKSAPNLRCFDTFYFKTCFVPQRRAIFMSHLPRWRRTRRFSEPTLRPSGATKYRKNTVFRDFPTSSRPCNFCAPACIFSLLTFSLSDLLSSDFCLV